MATDELRVPLLNANDTEDGFDNLALADVEDDVGFSSGYDSAAEQSDSECFEVKVKPTTNDVTERNTDTALTFKSTANLCAHLKYILSLPELCDVTFLVGPKQVPIHGVKAILGTRSRVMYQLILEKQRELEAEKKNSIRKSRGENRLTIHVHKYTPEDFRQFIQFIHCGAVDFTPSNVTGILCCAKQFQLDDLSEACWSFINFCRKAPDNSMKVIEHKCHRYCHFKTACRLLAKIQNASKSVENSYSPKRPSRQSPRSSSMVITTV